MHDGRCHHIAVMLGDFPGVNLVDDIRHPGAVGLHHALGRARSAARELDGLGRVERKVDLRGGCIGMLRAQGGKCHPARQCISRVAQPHTACLLLADHAGVSRFHHDAGLERIRDAADFGFRAFGFSGTHTLPRAKTASSATMCSALLLAQMPTRYCGVGSSASSPAATALTWQRHIVQWMRQALRGRGFLTD